MTTLAFPTVPKFSVHHAARPMMARDADAMYWMSRYVERAEHTARLLMVNATLLMDVGDLAPKFLREQWQGVLTILRCEAAPAGDARLLGSRIAHHLTFNADNHNSMYTGLSRARENARAIRENISAEMWESINKLYWSIRGDDALARFEESPEDFYRQVMNDSMLFQGLTDQTMAHDQRWLFTQLGKYLERIDITCRAVETKFNILQQVKMETALRTIQWMAVLRSCCSIETYRRNHAGDMDPLRVISFILLERNFPRSVRYGVAMAHQALAAIRAETNPLAIDPGERILGRLSAQLEYAEPSEIAEVGVPDYMQKMQAQIAEVAVAVQKAYFLY